MILRGTPRLGGFFLRECINSQGLIELDVNIILLTVEGKTNEVLNACWKLYELRELVALM